MQTPLINGKDWTSFVGNLLNKFRSRARLGLPLIAVCCIGCCAWILCVKNGVYDEDDGAVETVWIIDEYFICCISEYIDNDDDDDDVVVTVEFGLNLFRLFGL